MSKDEYRVMLFVLESIVDLNTKQILIMKMLSLDPWRGDEKIRQEWRDVLAREESRIEQAEQLLSEIRASLG